MDFQEKLVGGVPTLEARWPFWYRAKWGFVFLVVTELIVGVFTLGLSVTNNPLKGILNPEVAVETLFTMIVLGTIVGGLLFHSLGRYVLRSRNLLDQLNDGICVVSDGWKITNCNQPFSRITGIGADVAMGRSIESLFQGCRLPTSVESGQRWECEFKGSRPDGVAFCASASFYMIEASNGQPRNGLITLKDITEIKRQQDHIHKLAFVDELTGLANRQHFQSRLDEAIAKSRRKNEKFAVLFLDLDGFKVVNDSLGHKAGDKLLRTVGARLSSVVRRGDMLARIGGDEFCILLAGLADEEGASRVAMRLLEAVGEPVEIEGRMFRPRGSIGIAQFPRDGDNRETILQAADTAMYAAKRDGKHRFAFYKRALTEAAERRLMLEQDLRAAIEGLHENPQFELLYQPQVSLRTGRLVGVEALIRWHHPERGMISPDEFIPVAERIGLIDQLGNWVIDSACRQMREWIDGGIVDFTVAVNISGSHFRSSSLVEVVQCALVEYHLAPCQLELEVTEGVMQVGEESVSIFHRIKQLGVAIAIDDFGTGYSSLSSLKKLPLDSLKVDREFVRDVLDDQRHSVIIATIIGMGQALGMKIIAEGVETQEQLVYLRGLNCDVVQGYFFSPPVSAAEIPELARKDFLHALKQENNKKEKRSLLPC